MKTQLAGKVALVTGASRGIGLSIAQKLNENGASLALACRQLTPELEQLKEETQKSGRELLILMGDLSNESIPAELIRETIEYFGKLDIVINNAGIAVPASIEETDTGLWDTHMNLNARAPFLLCKEAIPYLKDSDYGTIINISSVVGIKGYVNQCAYTASKHALIGMTKVLAQEVKKYGIRVHALCPGGVDTDMVGKTRPDLDKSGLISPTEIAEIVEFLLTHRGNAMIDDVHIRRIGNDPWF